MKKKRSEIAYFILVLLILLVVVIIGGMSAMLFNIETTGSRHDQNDTVTQVNLLTNAAGAIIPVAETRIEIPPEETPAPEEKAAAGGTIPAVCISLSAKIQSRSAFWGPATHEVTVNPTRVRFAIDLPASQPTEGPNNIR
jgi:hypothetical protein